MDPQPSSESDWQIFQESEQVICAANELDDLELKRHLAMSKLIWIYYCRRFAHVSTRTLRSGAEVLSKHQKMKPTLQKTGIMEGPIYHCHNADSAFYTCCLDSFWVIFLGDGQLAYMGPPDDALTFFDSLNLVCPDDYNPADYIIDILAIDRQNGGENDSIVRIQKVTKAFAESDLTRQLNEKLKTFKGFGADSGVTNSGRKKVGFFRSFFLLLKRALIDNLRNPALARVKFVQRIVMGLFIGLLYLNTKLDEEGVYNLNGAMFFITAELTFSTLYGVMSFLPHDFALVVREHHDGLYSLFPYYLSRILSYTPIFVLDGVFMLSVSYWMVGFAQHLQFFFVMLGIGILVEQSAAAAGVMISTVAPSYNIAVTVSGPVLTILLLTGGMFANVGQIPKFVRWTQHLSWFKYGFEAMAINQWRGTGDFLQGNKTVTAEEILDSFSFKESNFWWNIITMAGFIMGFYLIGFVGLYIRIRRHK